ncbi:retropepsin-like aspartic protease family protein [Novosphingobium album (ex Liu et al. 2023)]|uniref:TIGR02281 family clan AA aspartic protease n=1 Tax=Novosphingobium album (ex Liu et al. 2023) TaxID=3031130 RepID=A0ABT5WVY4_9SPHN|nr:TIGR02281 family clan AA aspartic protease [Novosphingobium album (ex Liu et al. 2023)]MDE8654069.1 TIGR02281 family clan AA aspartic protease [Novosphingobium album (ex Liu et al. 2023)]
MDFPGLIQFLAEQPLLSLAIVAIFVTTLGGMLRRPSPTLGRLLQGIGNLGLVAALLLTIAQVARFTTGRDLALPQLDMPLQRVEGGETRVPMDADGHFWLTASVNGTPRRFLVDTGATITAISPETAAAGKVPAKAIPQTVAMRTANGQIRAELATIDELRFGNVVARDLDTVIAPGLGDANVIGMNLLSRLASWRVEGQTLILVPRHPQPVPES